MYRLIFCASAGAFLLLSALWSSEAGLLGADRGDPAGQSERRNQSLLATLQLEIKMTILGIGEHPWRPNAA
jgi:hypothetical protein